MTGWDYIAQIVLFRIYILCAMRDIKKDYLAGYNSWIKILLKSILATEGP